MTKRSFLPSRLGVVTGLLVAAAGCGPAATDADEDVAAGRAGIRNGRASGDTTVVAIDGPGGSVCSGYLIAPNTVLTARHCFFEAADPELPLDPTTLHAEVNGQRKQGLRYDFPETGTAFRSDIGLLLLEDDLDSVPTEFGPQLKLKDAGKTAKLWGAGTTTQANSAGTMREGAIVFVGQRPPPQEGEDNTFAGMYEFKAGDLDANHKDTIGCRGDSGGGVFLDDKLIGVLAGATPGLLDTETVEQNCARITRNWVTPYYNHATWMEEALNAETGRFPNAIALHLKAKELPNKVVVHFLDQGQNNEVEVVDSVVGLFPGETVVLVPTPTLGEEFVGWEPLETCPCWEEICEFQVTLPDIGFYACQANFRPIPPPNGAGGAGGAGSTGAGGDDASGGAAAVGGGGGGDNVGEGGAGANEPGGPTPGSSGVGGGGAAPPSSGAWWTGVGGWYEPGTGGWEAAGGGGAGGEGGFGGFGGFGGGDASTGTIMGGVGGAGGEGGGGGDDAFTDGEAGGAPLRNAETTPSTSFFDFFGWRFW